MADFVVNLLVERLSQLLAEEANSFGGLEDQVKSLHGKLRPINIFLNNSEGKGSGHEMVGDKSKGKGSGHEMVGDKSKGKVSSHEMVGDKSKGKVSGHEMGGDTMKWWGQMVRDDFTGKQKVRDDFAVKQKVKDVIRKSVDIAYEAEDVIERIIFNVATQTDTPEKIDNATRVRALDDVAKKIERLNKEIDKIYDNIEKYGIERAEPSVDAATEALQKRRREVEEDDVVGFDYHSTTLVKQLTEGNPQLDVVSIVAKGGSGKTTLARKIYNNVDIKSHFNFRAWVYVSFGYRTRDVLLEILKSEMRKSDGLTRKKLLKYSSEDELKKKLFKCLQGKRYLVVLDDIWRTKVWDEIRSAFPDDSNGSRILITSRIKNASLTPPYLLPVLNEDDSWKLLSKKVFRGETCPPELVIIGRQMAVGCHGIPISIVVLAGIFANKEKTYETWKKINVGREYMNFKKILELCYFHLPRRLKPCFLYLGVFPKGVEIPVRLLINLWVAEGFIQHSRNIDPEDVAEDYLDELIDRSLVQVVSRRTDGGAKACRIHGLVGEFCSSTSVKDNFLEVFSQFPPTDFGRISLPCSIDPIMKPLPIGKNKYARSLLIFNKDTYDLGTKQWKWVHDFFKSVRVLNFGHVNLYSVPTMIANLIHLRYLGIESDALKAIPVSIGNLINLVTLDMRGTFLNCLPKGIWKLRRLRNLYMSGPVSLPNDLDPDVKALCNLQVLSTVSLDPQSSLLIPNVRKLGLWFASDESNNEVVDVLKSLHHLHRLQTLKIINCSEYHCLPMSLPSTITKITLRLVHLKVRRDMRVLGNLPNLQILKLQSCLLSSKLHVFAGSFPRLLILKLEDLKIKKWKQRRGAMPCLKHLVIKRCIELIMLPSNVLSLTALQDVEVLWSSSKLAKMLQELQIEVGFKLLVDLPLTEDLHEQIAT